MFVIKLSWFRRAFELFSLKNHFHFQVRYFPTILFHLIWQLKKIMTSWIKNIMTFKYYHRIAISKHKYWDELRSYKSFCIAFSGYTESTFAVISIYCLLFIVAAGGNLSVVITIFRSKRHRRSRVSLMIFHLAVADLMVAFIMIPLEVMYFI